MRWVFQNHSGPLQTVMYSCPLAVAFFIACSAATDPDCLSFSSIMLRFPLELITADHVWGLIAPAASNAHTVHEPDYALSSCKQRVPGRILRHVCNI